jgi:hypothetical protein
MQSQKPQTVFGNGLSYKRLFLGSEVVGGKGVVVGLDNFQVATKEGA